MLRVGAGTEPTTALDPLAVRFEADHLVRDPLDYLADVGFEIESVERSKWGIVERVLARKPPERRPLAVAFGSMCAACAMAAMAGATGARSWLQARHDTWMTPRRMKVATVSIFAAATIGSTVGLQGTTPPSHPTATQPNPPPAAHRAGVDESP